ncbi:DUF1643 domain-containing protein [Hydrogenophaga sp.]|uniref:DUF1643 domain-containing protein n=1 Tax=Hydrogenophaga sp. TaxID=1904254 RepID=UPI003429E514
MERQVAPGVGLTYGFFGVNPSTADAVINDHTVRKWIGFTHGWGGARFIVGNVFAFRAKEVTDLAGALDAIGPENDRHLRGIADEVDVLVPCWGAVGKVPRHLRPRFEAVAAMLRASGKPVRHLGLTACGNPKHPLNLAYVTPLTDWV